MSRSERVRREARRRAQAEGSSEEIIFQSLMSSGWDSGSGLYDQGQSQGSSDPGSSGSSDWGSSIGSDAGGGPSYGGSDYGDSSSSSDSGSSDSGGGGGGD